MLVAAAGGFIAGFGIAVIVLDMMDQHDHRSRHPDFREER